MPRHSGIRPASWLGRRQLAALTAGVLAAVIGLAAPAAYAQSQAANGSIEGTVTDESGAVLPGVTVTVTNLDTGSERVVVTTATGVYRALLLPLGKYRVVAELEGFKKFEQVGIEISAGTTAAIDVKLGVGALTEVVSVTADKPIVDVGKVDLGRNITETEMKSLPLVSRNPYNFALLQPGVSGFENSEFGVPRFQANGTLLRVNYQIDGNTNTQKDRAGLRLLPVSEVLVREVKVVTSGYAPEFGQTTGIVYNAITPSGTNAIHGDAAYRFRRKAMSARPFFLNSPVKPDTNVDTLTATVGGPVIKDKLHYYFGFEDTSRDLSADRNITVTDANALRLGLSTDVASGVIPASQSVKFFVGKADYQASQANRLTFRYIGFWNDSPNNVQGGTNTTQVATDFLDRMDSVSGQLVTTLGSNKLNELRLQFARRKQSRDVNDLSGTGPSILVTGAATFGGPFAGAQDAGFRFTQNIWQVVDNFTYLFGDHSLKAGFDFQNVYDDRTRTPQLQYTFPSVDAYVAARDGINRRSYSTFLQFVGEPYFEMTNNLWSFFAQDDWKVTSNFKLVYGLRYDIYQPPDGDPNAAYAGSRSFNTDGNNWGPRAGFSWALGADEKTVVRGSTGIMYDQPLLAAYENAGQLNGVRAVSISLNPGAAGAPDFPNSINSSSVVVPTQSISTVDPDFHVMKTWQNNIQVDHALGNNYSVSAGFVYVKGYDLPLIRNINLINPIGTLADGRPVYSTAVSAATRLDPRFNQINSVESVGDSSYKAMTIQFTKRYANNWQYDLSYTLGKGEDNAPLTSVLSVQGDEGLSDPSNIDRDKGPNILNQRHTLAGSIVYAPTLNASSAWLNRLANDNQFGIALAFNSGVPQNVRSNLDLNGDSVLADRPLGVDRNSIYLPARYNVDLRYSRYIPIRGPMRGEVQAEFKNLFNSQQTSNYNNLRIVTTNAAGEALTPIPTSPDDISTVGRTGYESRQFQIGFRFTF